MKRATVSILVGSALLAVLPAALLAQKPVTQGEVVEVTSSIEAIDKTARLVTLKGPDGLMDTVVVGPEVKRFDELKVGDKVTFRYYDSLVYQIRKPGEATTPRPTGETSVVRTTGLKPGATVSEQMMATVKVKAIDEKVPSVTVESEDGRTLSFKVDDKKNLKGVSVGDKVEITYTSAVMITVK
jgi:Cu/Ag efflux protein CusF